MPDSAAAPFLFGDGPDACLLLHGFTGAPSEVRPLAERLARDGMRVSVPLLPGHGVSAAELVKISRRDLFAFAGAELEKLRGARRIFIAGLSAGGMLALELVAKASIAASSPGADPQTALPLAALALMAPAIRFAGSTWHYTNTIGRLPLGRLPLLLRKGKRDVQGNAVPIVATKGSELRSDGSLARVPLSWGRELRLLSSETFLFAKDVRLPTLVTHGGRDRTASVAGSQLLMTRIGARDAQLLIFPESGHVLPIGIDGPAVCDAIAGFFARIAGGGEIR